MESHKNGVVLLFTQQVKNLKFRVLRAKKSCYFFLHYYVGYQLLIGGRQFKCIGVLGIVISYFKNELHQEFMVCFSVSVSRRR